MKNKALAITISIAIAVAVATGWLLHLTGAPSEVITPITGLISGALAAYLLNRKGRGNSDNAKAANTR
ncbi:hypothetical protein MHT86_01800 [Corynebacterium mastitidis]|uniref:hypothetical protein n=1 Tax=Corynebacterium mastitidis TaxID=161890 RepID=UPI0012FF31B5|nr:hypothetical protein [Corynebacterium mastitidis]MCH6196232.1 hypothetical protein [Corynebacterium mastitidis]